MEAILAEDVKMKYKNGVQALSGLNLSVGDGEIFSLLGQNGAGKSTLIRILTTYLRPASGRITMLGADIGRDAAKIRAQIACVAQQISIDTHLSLEENMMFQSRLYKIPKADARDRMEKLIADFGLEQYRRYPVASYSGGVKRRLDIALNMMSNPRILFLDEPTVGIDVQSRMAMWDMVRQIRDGFGTTVFLTTHYLEEADQLSDTICIMKDGKEVIQGSPYMLRSLLRRDMLRVRFASEDEAKRCLPLVRKQFLKREISLRNDELILHTRESRADMEQTARFLLEQQIPFCGLEMTQPALEDVFLQLTREEKEGWT